MSVSILIKPVSNSLTAAGNFIQHTRSIPAPHQTANRQFINGLMKVANYIYIYIMKNEMDYKLMLMLLYVHNQYNGESFVLTTNFYG